MHLQLPSPSPRVSLAPSTAAAASAGAELVTSDGRSLSLVSAKLTGEARGGLARLVLEQRFVNHYDEHLRVTYRMPLPADGAVSGYAFEIAERVIRGQIDKKHRARERFEQAVASGRTAAILDQERADIFTQEIGNLPAREALVARITVDVRLVWLPEGEWELRFPTVIGPRYVGSADTVADVRATHVKVTDQGLAAGIQIAIAVKDAIAGGAKPSSPSHPLVKNEAGLVELGTAAKLDRDIVVRWPVAAPSVGITLDAMRPEAGDVGYGLLTIVPPAPKSTVAVPRDLTVLLDTSGSMDGVPLAKAKQVVALMIDSLGERDRLELIEFSSAPSRYKEGAIEATAKAKAEAIKWVKSRKASGGTEMRTAVIEALETLRIGAQRQVVVVTDGYVGGEQQILDALLHRLPASCRLHVLGVGSAVNRSLATALARAGRGAEVIVGPDEDAERGAKRLLDRTRAPVLTNVVIAGSALAEGSSDTPAIVPAALPDVFAGAPLVAALALRPEGGELLVRGNVADGTWEQRLSVRPLRAGDGNQAIAALYGRERVADLEAHAVMDNAAATDRTIETIGLTYQISTRMTSWVAIDENRAVAGPTREEIVPQELPYGTSAAAFGLRQAAPAYDSGMRTRAGSITPGAEKMMAELQRQHEESRVRSRTVVTEVRPPASGAYDDAGDFAEELSTGSSYAPRHVDDEPTGRAAKAPAPAQPSAPGRPPMKTMAYVAPALPEPTKPAEPKKEADALPAAAPETEPAPIVLSGKAQTKQTARVRRYGRWWVLPLVVAFLAALIALLVWTLA
jgi:Ca-activated chloride channel family protein